MQKDQYVIVKRGGKWWITIEGQRQGPYDERRDAVDDAVRTAQVYERTGRKSEVSWDDPADGVPTVYASK